MKNRFFIIKVFIYFFLIFFANKILSAELEFNASEIQSLDNGNIIEAYNGVEIKDIDGIVINGDKFKYDKIKSIVKINGNIVIIDSINDATINTEEVIYLRNENKIITKDFTQIKFSQNYTIDTSNVVYDRNLGIITTQSDTIVKDNLNNTLSFKGFKLSTLKKILDAENVKLIDYQSNEYNIELIKFNLNTDEIAGKDLSINFSNNLFQSKKNQPRLKGNAIFLDNNITKVNKGVFTTCKKRDGCPPWVLSASKIEHDKKKQIINYKNTWLKVYDVPVLYFPKFFHPDPTVKRQSGFLIPKFAQSNNIGNYLNIPYYYVIAENRDFTFNPRFYTNEKTVLQGEYRHVTKNAKHIFDASIKNESSLIFDKKPSSETHFFSKSTIDMDLNYFDNSKIDIKLQQTSENKYLKTYKINSAIMESDSTLNSNLIFQASKEDLDVNLSAEVYEDLSKTYDSDRYEYIFPNYTLVKDIQNNFGGDLSITSTGNNKLYDTNVNEKVLINDVKYNSINKITSFGFLSNYEILVKNFNVDSKNSSKYKNKRSHDLQSILNYQIKYPLRKIGKKYDQFLTPIFSVRYSPNKSKNIKNEDVIIDYNNIFSLSRISADDTVEGGQSITIGNEFKILDKLDSELLSFNLATVIRDEINSDLPLSSKLGNTSSDIVGELNLKPNKYFNLEYDFSLDNDLSRLDYSKANAEISINNFITSFEFLEKNNIIGEESYLSNKTTFNFDDNHSIEFSTRKNKEKDLTEYYNLIYQYKNDCLTAAVEYKKDYYSDGDLKPEEQLFFSITIVPFGKTSTPSLSK